VERNALRANLVSRAEEWRWSSLAVRRMMPAQAQRNEVPTLADWPVDRPRDWLRAVNQAQSKREVEALRCAVQRGRPFGSPTWEKQAATRLGLQSTLHPRGRPRKGT
jgi:putative transposase